MRVLSAVTLALVLSGCAGSRPEAASLTLTAPGTVLAYRVTDAPATYPFVVTVTQNDAAGTAFAYDLADGQSVGTVRMSASARASAPGGMLNAFGSEDYDLTDRTSVWMARDDVQRLQAGEQVAIRDGEGGYTFEIVGCDLPFAVAGAGLTASDIVHVNCHATSTVVGDVGEATAVKRAFGDHPVLTAPKSALGHLVGGAGAVEGIIALLSVRDDIVPATLNLTDKDPKVELDVVAGEPRKMTVDAAVNNSFGFGGHNASLVFTKA